VMPHGRHQGGNVEPVPGDATPQSKLLIWGERDEALPDFADAIGPHKGFLPLHAGCTGDALRRNQLRQAEPDAEPAECFGHAVCSPKRTRAGVEDPRVALGPGYVRDEMSHDFSPGL